MLKRVSSLTLKISCGSIKRKPVTAQVSGIQEAGGRRQNKKFI
jgi:hypothetical protein